MPKKKPTRELPPDWWCEGQTDITDLLNDPPDDTKEDDDGHQPPDADPR